MVGIVAVLVLVTLSVVVTRVGAAALEATGVSRDLAHFQARSAFTGVGYTTREAESITDHPARRRIILALMLLGNAGIVSVIASLVIGLGDAPRGELFLRAGTLAAGLGVLWWLSSMSWFNRLVKRAIRRGLRRWTDLEVRDYVALLDISGDYAVREVGVQDDHWLARTELAELDLNAEGVLVLAIRRDNGEFLGAPRPDVELRAGDTVLLYGHRSSLQELGDRRRGASGDAEHEQSVRRQRHVQAAEHARDEQAEAQREATRARAAGEDHRADVEEERSRRAGQRAQRREDRADAVGGDRSR